MTNVNTTAYDDAATLYTIRVAGPLDGGARDDCALIIHDADDQPLARWWFSADALDAPTDDVDGANSIASWVQRTIVNALTTDGYNACADCGNPLDGPAAYDCQNTTAVHVAQS